MKAKRVFDIAAATLLLCGASIILLFAMAAVRCAIGSPVLFKQTRPGHNGRPFTLYKLRTMTDARDENGGLLPDHLRLTKTGRLIRKLSIDELPQLFNVLKGDISLVGPRPLLMDYLPLYTAEQARRHEVKPGITGWAQINGRNAISWEEKFKLDVWYVDNRTFLLDLKILLLTVKKVLVSEGIHQAGHVTAKRFTGSGDMSS
ncbi:MULTISPECIES: sugar transferase [Bacillus amyloliquefaciens group]|uniref:sugar transferase n=1 Tax=Bacillus amyloliquefaciens group TaxID=1938374 RepID=UPI000C81D511|nr:MULTISPECIES: sugar transferase [Bacillus amyloliquefaciens group]MED4523249.1 sugar transferase [Bacillus velezensis]